MRITIAPAFRTGIAVVEARLASAVGKHAAVVAKQAGLRVCVDDVVDHETDDRQTW
jgi:hypothetical protein